LKIRRLCIAIRVSGSCSQINEAADEADCCKWLLKRTAFQRHQFCHLRNGYRPRAWCVVGQILWQGNSSTLPSDVAWQYSVHHCLLCRLIVKRIVTRIITRKMYSMLSRIRYSAHKKCEGKATSTKRVESGHWKAVNGYCVVEKRRNNQLTAPTGKKR